FRPLCPVAGGKAGLPLRPHCNPRKASPPGEQPRSFPRQVPRLLASFAAWFSSSKGWLSVAFGEVSWPAIPSKPLKAGYAVPNTPEDESSFVSRTGSSHAVVRRHTVAA